MGKIIKQKNKDLYLEEYEGGKILWTPILMEAKVFLTELHAIEIARFLQFETEII